MAQTEFGQLQRDDSGHPTGWGYVNISGASTTTAVIKATPGVLHSVTINKPLGSGVVTIYDNTAASGTAIATITLPATLLTNGPCTATYDVVFGTGLSIATTAAATDVTVSYI